LQANVAHGVQWFEETQPKTWRQDIRTTINEDSPLEMGDCHKCMISRYFDTPYYRGVEKARPDLSDEQRMDWGARHGFDVPKTYDTYPNRRLLYFAWRYLEDLWMTELCKFN